MRPLDWLFFGSFAGSMLRAYQMNKKWEDLTMKIIAYNKFLVRELKKVKGIQLAPFDQDEDGPATFWKE